MAPAPDFFAVWGVHLLYWMIPYTYERHDHTHQLLRQLRLRLQLGRLLWRLRSRRMRRPGARKPRQVRIRVDAPGAGPGGRTGSVGQRGGRRVSTLVHAWNAFNLFLSVNATGLILFGLAALWAVRTLDFKERK